MENFEFVSPTHFVFGKGAEEQVGSKLAERGARTVLLHFGGQSAVKSGLIDRVKASLDAQGIKHVELGGVRPNPEITLAREGIALCKEHDVDWVLAVGGGSTIDCAKAVAAGVTCEGSAWDMVTKKAPIKSILPIIAVLTIAATGSEMDTSAVISNMETHEKVGVSAPGMRPVVSIMDPEYSFTVSKFQTAAGTADIMSHVMEVYFNNHPDAYLQNRFAEAVLKTCVKYGHRAWQQPDDYEARANLMWASSWAINGLLTKGAPVGWSVHPMEHELSAYYDVTHGAGLAVMFPAWMEFVYDANPARFAYYGREVFGLAPTGDVNADALSAIDETRSFFASLGMPITLAELDVEEDDIKAKFEDGVLKIAVPKKQEQPKLEEKKTISIEG